jgi:hypothetical protein
VTGQICKNIKKRKVQGMLHYAKQNKKNTIES